MPSMRVGWARTCGSAPVHRLLPRSDTAGDGFFASFDGPARAVRCACAIRDAVRGLGSRFEPACTRVSAKSPPARWQGIAVHVGARVAAIAEAGEVRVSSTVKDLVAGSGLEFDDLGRHELKGIPGEWQLYAVR